MKKFMKEESKKAKKLLHAVILILIVILIIWTVTFCIMKNRKYKGVVHEKEVISDDINSVYETDAQDSLSMLEKPVEQWTMEDINLINSQYEKAVKEHNSKYLEEMFHILLLASFDSVTPQYKKDITSYVHTVNINMDTDKCQKILSSIDKIKYPEVYNLLYKAGKYQHQFLHEDYSSVQKSAEFDIIVTEENDLLVVKISANCMKETYTQEIKQLKLDTTYSDFLLKKIQEMGETKESFTDLLLTAENQEDVELLYNLYEEQYEKVFFSDSYDFYDFSDTGKIYLGEYGSNVFYSVNGADKLKNFINAMIKETEEKNYLSGYCFTTYLEFMKEYSDVQMENQYYEMVTAIYRSEDRLSNDCLDAFKLKMHKRMEMYGVWCSLCQKLEPNLQMEGKGNQKYYEIQNLENSGGGINGYTTIVVQLKNQNGDIATINNSNIFCKQEEYKPDTIKVDIDWNPYNLKTTISNIKVQKLEELEKIDNYICSKIYDLTRWIPYIFPNDKRLVPDCLYDIDAQKDMIPANCFWKMKGTVTLTSPIEESKISFLKSEASGIHYNIKNYSYIANFRIYDPYIIQNIKMVEDSGLKAIIPSEKFDPDRTANYIGYQETSDEYQYFISEKDEKEIRIYQQYYDKLLYGKGDILIMQMDQEILNQCLFRIDLLSNIYESMTGIIAEYGSEELILW